MSQLNLFKIETDPYENLLPFDGEVIYLGKILPEKEADSLQDLMFHSLDWQADSVQVLGKILATKRKVAWYGDRPFSYSYSGTTKVAQPWTSDILSVKDLIENRIGETFNSCLINLYHNGAEGVSWHSDAEKDLKKNGTVASLTLGAERKFSFKHKKTKESTSIVLEHGSLLLMKGETQTHWLHSLPTTKKIHRSRINFTFRTIVQ